MLKRDGTRRLRSRCCPGSVTIFFVVAVWLVASAVVAETIVFFDGSELEVPGFEVQKDVVVWKTPDGKLHSIPRAYVDLGATLNQEQDRASEALALLDFRRMSDFVASSARAAAEAHRRVSGSSDVSSRVLAHAFARGFDDDRFFEVAARTFRSKARASELEPSVAWLRTPTARRFARLQRFQPQVPGGEFDSFLVSLDERPPSDARLRLVERIDRASRASEAAAGMQSLMLRALIEGVNRSRAPSQRLSSAEVASAIESVKGELSSRAHTRIRLALLYTYRDVTDAELTEYLRYLESPGGRFLSGVVYESLLAATEDAAARSGDVIAESLTDLQKTKV